MTPAADKSTVITYLEMTAQPTSPSPPVPATKLALLRAEKPNAAFYRFLYGAVGGPWGWPALDERDDDTLEAAIGDRQTEIYVLYAGGVPAGFAELDLRRFPDIELARFGIVPDYGGRGLANHFLRWTVDQAWTHEPERLWVRARSDGDPHLLALYQQNGFVVYRQEQDDAAGP